MAACAEQQCNDPARIAEIFRRTGLKPGDLAEGKMVDRVAEAEFVSAACDVLADPSFAATTGLQFLHATSLTAYIAKHSKNLRNAITNSGRYYSVVDAAFSYSLNASGNVASLEINCVNPDFDSFSRLKEFLLFAAVTRIRTLTNTNVSPIEMRFDFDSRQSAEAIQRLARFPVVFGAEKLEILLPLSALDLPVPTFDPDLRNHLMEYGDRLLKERPGQSLDFKTKIKRLVADSLPGRIATAADVASAVGMSTRSFSRRLREDDTSFRTIVDEVRSDMAQVYLRDSFSLSEIAFALDYADQAAFSTAFKRWQGCSPKQYRDRQQPTGA